MEQPWLQMQNALARDLWSKLIDGLLAALILFLLWLFVALAISPIDLMFGQPGLLVYTVSLLAVAMYALQQAVLGSHSETTRAWFGIAAGSLAWSVAEVAVFLGAALPVNAGSVVLIIMVALIVTILWRALPPGGRYFALTFLLNWGVHILMRAQEWLSAFSPIFALSYRMTGYLSLLSAGLVVGYILFHTQRRIQRVSAALLLWFLLSLAVYVFRGALY